MSKKFNVDAHHESLAIDFWDESNPNAIINLVPTSIGRYMKTIPSEWRDMSEDEATERVSKLHGGKLPIDLRRLRIAFWVEFHNLHFRRQSTPGKKNNMSMVQVYGSVCSTRRFEILVSNSFNLAYVLTPLAEYETAMQELLYYAQQEMMDIMATPIIKKDGNIDKTIANLKYNIWCKLDERVKGPIVQRIESKNFNVTANLNQSDQSNQAMKASMEELDKQLLALKQATNSLPIRDQLKLTEDSDVITLEKETTPLV